ncbi:MAG: P-II family nitrogen regulator [Phycisphaeraceae bacterium]|nr:P-II family nitrogen regulator [Phycisphaeraceae bacterium]
MKMIVAIIQPDRLDQVHQALIDKEIFRITVSRCTGHGQQEDTELYRGQEVTPPLLPKVRLEIAVNDSFVQPTIDAIIQGARHGDGKIGDGKIFVTHLEQCIRIRTGESGGTAI